MILHSLSTKDQDRHFFRSAKVQFENGNSKASDLWFQFETTDPDLIPSKTMDPFVVSLLLLAMNRRERIRVEGSLDSKVYEGLFKYQKIYHDWFPERFFQIEIEADQLRTSPSQEISDEVQHSQSHFKKKVSTAFSGGVDSFYSFFTLLEKKTLTHTLFMAGFDMPLNLKKSIAELISSYEQLMKEKSIFFTHGSTNVRNLVNTVDWTNAHGQALIGTALFFEKDWDEFFIPSSYTTEAHPKWGTHPKLDGLLSTQHMNINHHGVEHNRVDKLRLITQYPESFERLRVCWIQDLGLRNCGECEKCIRTQTALKILGYLNHYPRFVKRLTLNDIKNLPQRTYQGRLFAKELIQESLKRGKFTIAVLLVYSLIKRKIRYFFKTGP